MPYARSSFPDFELGNPLYIGATVTFYKTDVNGVKTTDLATLYANTIGSELLTNPQVLDSAGKFTVPVYIDEPVIGTITNTISGVPDHDTGIIVNPGRRRGAYVAGTRYYPNDLFQDPATGYLYSALNSFIGVSIAVDTSNGNIAIEVTPADLMAAINAAAQASNAAVSAAAAASSATSATASATAAATSATASSSSATSSATSATSSSNSAAAAATSATAAQAAAAAALGSPQGRLSLTTGVPVMTGNATAQTTIYYLPYVGWNVPIWSGSAFAIANISTGISLALDANSGHIGFHQSGKLFDLFVFLNSSTPTLATGPSWANNIARNDPIVRTNGIWTNQSPIVLRFGTAIGNTTTVAAGQATYVGTFYATANGQTGMSFRNLAGECVLGLYNSYNRVPVSAVASEATASWSYSTGVWRPSNNNQANRVSFVDGLGQAYIRTELSQYLTVASGNVGAGVAMDSIAAAPVFSGLIGSAISTYMHSGERFLPQQGFHFAQAMEIAQGGSTTLYGSGSMRLALDMEI